MESNDKLYYDKLDLDPFTFSSPNSTGLNDLEFKDLLEDAVKATHNEKEVSKDSSHLPETLVELLVNNSEVFVPLQQKEAINQENISIINNTDLQQDWKQPLPQQKPKIEQTTFNKKHFNIHNYLVLLNKMRNEHIHANTNPNTNMNNNANANANANALSMLQNKKVNKPLKSFKNDSSIPVQEIKKTTTKQSKKSSLNLASLLLAESEKSLSTTKANHPSHEHLMHIIRQLNKKTLEKLQNRLTN